MPRFNSISFYQNRPKIELFLQKNTKFLSAGLRPQTTRATPALSQISGYAPESNHVFAHFCTPEFSLMLRFKSIIFIKISPKLSYFCKKKFFLVLGALPLDHQWPLAELTDPQNSLSQSQYFSYALYTKCVLPRCCSYFQVIES